MTSFDVLGARLQDGPKLVQGRGSGELAPLAGGASGAGTEFSRSLAEAIREVDSLQADSAAKAQSLALGEGGEVHDLMLAMGKSEVAFNLMLEVRNKMLEAWQTLQRTVL